MEATSMIGLAKSCLDLIKKIKCLYISVGLHLATETDLRATKLQLTVSFQELQSWTDTWTSYLGEAGDLTAAHRIWGNHGSERIRDLLLKIADHGKDIEAELKSIEATAIQGRKNESRLLSRLRLMRARRKQPEDSGMSRCRGNLEEFTRQITILNMMTEVAFRKAHQDYKPSVQLIRPSHCWENLEDMLQNQKETLAFHNFCACSCSQTFLELDLIRKSGLSRWRSETVTDLHSHKHYTIHKSSKTEVGGFYSWNAKPLKVNELAIAKDFGDVPRSRYFEELENVLSTNETKCVVLTSNRAEERVKFSMRREYGSVNVSPVPFAIRSTQAHGTERGFLKQEWTYSISHHERLKLAYKIAEFSLFSLGTPFMAELSRTGLHQILVDGEIRYALKLSTSAGDDTSERHSTISIRKQISMVGDLLMDLALDSYSRSNDPQIKAEELLAVQGSMGRKYRAACEFCLNRRQRYKLPNELREPERHGEKHEMGDEPVRESSEGTNTNREESKPQRNSRDSQMSWNIVLEPEESLEECMIELQEFHSEVFQRLNQAFAATELKAMK